MDLWLENPYSIKHSSGFQRGKNDRQDAKKIACYTLRFEDKACLFIMPAKAIATLMELVSEQEIYIVNKNRYQAHN